MHRKKRDPIKRRIRRFVANEALKFVEEDVFEASLPVTYGF